MSVKRPPPPNGFVFFVPPHPPCDPGGAIQHLVHHGPGGSRPGLALHGGRGRDVYPGFRWVHRSTAGKHLPAQVCESFRKGRAREREREREVKVNQVKPCLGAMGAF